MYMKIDDAPFTDAEKAAIKALGITSADWGHPDVVLPYPVDHFKDVMAITTRMPVAEEMKEPRWISEDTQPHGL